MKPNIIILMIIFVVLLSGCKSDSKTAIVRENPTYTLEEKDNIKNADKINANDSLKDAKQDLPLSKNQSASFTSTSKNEVSTAKSIDLNTKLFDYLSAEKNRDSVAERARELHGGNLHNSCVYYTSEVLRRIGVKIPDSMCSIPLFIKELKEQGFKTSYDLEKLKVGDICFTTDVKGIAGGRPTHTYIFMGWESPGVAIIVDNQLYDYGNVFHPRLIDFHYLNNQKDKPKEATAFFMYK